MYSDLSLLCINLDKPLREAIAQMDRSGLGIVLVVNEEKRLVGTITDGDVRRAVLGNLNLGQPVSVFLRRKEGSLYERPITAPAAAGRATFLRLLQDHNISHLPLLDDGERVVGLITVDEFVPNRVLPLRAVVMAGGRGSRMLPLTENLPKPMLPVGSRPLMEIIIQQLKDAGIKRVHVTTHHKSEKISEHFGDGRDFGVELNYVTEDRPLGTAGALGLMEVPRETVLVINGDILTQMDFRAMLAFHREQQGDLTIAVRQYDIRIPFGVVECQGAAVTRITEKPLLNWFVNAGIYLLEPVVYSYMPNGKPFDMTDLIQRLLADGRRVVSFPVREYWLDIGIPDDYQKAQSDVVRWKTLR